MELEYVALGVIENPETKEIYFHPADSLWNDELYVRIATKMVVEHLKQKNNGTEEQSFLWKLMGLVGVAKALDPEFAKLSRQINKALIDSLNTKLNEPDF
jgi:hypothetical protein